MSEEEHAKMIAKKGVGYTCRKEAAMVGQKGRGIKRKLDQKLDKVKSTLKGRKVRKEGRTEAVAKADSKGRTSRRHETGGGGGETKNR